MMRLEVLLCTMDHRITQAAEVILPQQEGVCYLVSWQHTSDSITITPPAIFQQRSDVRLIETWSKGLAHNRNIALQHAQGDILLFADDDLRYTNEAFEHIRQSFVNDSSLHLLTTCIKRSDNTWHKVYPATTCSLQKAPHGYYVSSVELAVRRVAQLPKFDERFGLGSLELASGEEEIFVFDCLRRGLHAKFLPIHTATISNTTSTGTHFDTQLKVRRSKGAVLCYCHGRIGALLRCFKYTLCYQGPLRRYDVWHDLLWGINYIAQAR